VCDIFTNNDKGGMKTHPTEVLQILAGRRLEMLLVDETVSVLLHILGWALEGGYGLTSQPRGWRIED
jgi:hypothetical protein